MKILVIAPHAYYIDRGTPIAVDILVRALSQRGDEVDLVVYRDGEERDYPGLTIHRANTPKWLSNIGPGFSVRKVLADLWLFTRAWKLVRSRRYDVTHAGEEAVFFAMWFKLLYRLPYIYDMDSSIAQQLVEKKPWLKPLAWLFNWCETRAIRGAEAVASVCNALADLADEAGAEHVAPMHDISMLKDSTIESSGSLRRRLGIDGPIIMYVGNLEPYQGIDLLLEAFSIAVRSGCHATLVLAGGTREHIADYTARAEALGAAERVHFIGRWPAEKLDELLAESDILASPRTEGINTPMKVFPYMHMGKPLLATDLMTHNQILTPEVAMLAPPNSKQFAEAMLELAENPELRKKLGEAGREFVERNHTYPAHQERVDQLYDYVESKLPKTSDVDAASS